MCRAMAVEAARQAQAAAERDSRAAAARRELEKQAVSAARLRKIRAHRVSMLKASVPFGAVQTCCYMPRQRTTAHDASHTLECQ